MRGVVESKGRGEEWFLSVKGGKEGGKKEARGCGGRGGKGRLWEKNKERSERLWGGRGGKGKEKEEGGEKDVTGMRSVI